MTLYSGLQSQEKLEGLVILSGFLPQQDKIQSVSFLKPKPPPFTLP